MNKIKVVQLTKQYKKIIISLGVVIVIGGGIFFIKSKNSFGGEMNSLSDYVRTVNLEKSSINNSITVSGKVASAELTSVTSAFSEKIKTLNVKVGDLVKKGDVIAILDDTNIKKEIESKREDISTEREKLKASYDKTINSLNTAKANKSLNSAEQDKLVNISKQNLDTANYEFENCKASFQSEESKYKTMISAIKDKQDAYDNSIRNRDNLYSAWINAGGATNSKAYEDYNAAQDDLSSKERELEEAKSLYDYDRIAGNYNAALEKYNGKLSIKQTAQSEYDSAVSARAKAINNDDSEIATINESLKEINSQIQKLDKNDELKALEEKLEKTVLKAESDGKVTELKATVGSMTEGVIATIQSTDKLIISVNIPEYDISKVTVGMKAEISSDSLAKKIKGELVRISPTASQVENNSGFSADIAVSDAKGLFIGSKAKTEIIMSSKENVFVVPLDAVDDIDGESKIFIKNETGEFKETKVTVGMKNDYYVEVSGDGLKEGVEINANVNLEKFDNNNFESDMGGGF